MDQFRLILFWVFIAFFVVIGVASLLVQLGFPRDGVNPEFRKWALRSFMGAVIVAVVGLFRMIFADPASGISVGLQFPDNSSPMLEDHATYNYLELERGDVVTRHEGQAILVLEQGSWQVRLPTAVADKAVALRVKDSGGKTWVVDAFYPNHIFTKMVVRLDSSEPRVSEIGRPFIGMTPVFAAEPGREIAAQQGALRFNNYARAADAATNGLRNYEWRVFLDEPDAVLRTIRQVDYLLHASFSQPFRSVTDRSRNFELVASGWGVFDILVTVHYVDGREANTHYMLDFNKGWSAPPAAVRVPQSHRPYDQAFKDAVFQAHSGKWSETAGLMREAIANQPTQPQRTVQLDRKEEDYAPYSYLALALLQMKPSQCDEARNALSQSGLEKRSPWLSTNLDKARVGCHL